MTPVIATSAAGANGGLDHPPDAEREINILVTGYGLWGRIKKNPSHEIALRLPSSIPATSTHPKINLIIYTPLPVSYGKVSKTVPELLEKHLPDFVIHLGLHGGRPSFDLERSAPRVGFKVPDVEGRSWSSELGDEAVPGVTPFEVWSKGPDDSNTQRETEERGTSVAGGNDAQGPGQAHYSSTPMGGTTESEEDKKLEFPDRLLTRIKYDQVVEAWQTACKGSRIPVVGNDGVGTFLCGFIYYVSLAWFRRTRSKQEGPVVFVHMPALESSEDVQEGVKLITKLAESIVEVHVPG